MSVSWSGGLSSPQGASLPPDLDIHLIVDNYATHKHATVRRWLGAHPRFHVHYTPTYAWWLNQVEIWLNLITQRAIPRGTFRGVRDWVARSSTSCTTTTGRATPSFGPRRLTRSSRRSSELVKLSLGQHTS